MSSRSIIVATVAVTMALVVPASPAQAACAGTQGISNGHTICIVLPSQTLIGEQTITVTNSPNSDLVFFDWHPASGSIRLMEDFAPSPETADYSFVWPTEKYADATGTLEVRSGSAGATPVNVPNITLSNGGFHPSPTNCSNGCPPQAVWPGTADPVIAAVGDGPSDETSSNAVADSLVAANPPLPLFLFLGDIYETGTFTENRNHYGVSSLDSASPTLWGRLASVTQPTVGNHEAKNLTAWMDYFHGHPGSSSFTFGGVLFINVNSSKSFAVGSSQYNFVKNLVAPPATPPACIVAFWHIPALLKTTVDTNRLPMWQLLSDNGGDLVLNGHVHAMIQYEGLDRMMTAPGHMVQLVAGSGGHKLGGAPTDPRIQFSKGKIGGALYLTLVGAANGGVATSIAWAFKQASNGTVLSTGSVTC